MRPAGSESEPADSEAQRLTANRLDRLNSILACPECGGHLQAGQALRHGDALVDADLCCADCGVVGVVRGFRPSFHAEDQGNGWTPPGTSPVAMDLGTLRIDGDSAMVPEGVLVAGAGARISGTTGSAGVILEFLTHDWSGRAEVSCGETETEINLGSQTFGTHRVAIDEPHCRWSATLLPKPEDPERNQMVLRRVWALESSATLDLPDFVPLNLGNPYPERFGQLLREQADNAVVLDLGGGDRRHPDPRVLNFEYMKFDRSDFFGDGLNLPIRTDSVDLILSQAVLEHVPDPRRAVSEMRRILRPGGVVYAEVAFMQPLHAVPFHFFNVTEHGAQLLFQEFDVLEIGSAGGLVDTMTWLLRLVEADRVLGPLEIDGLLRDLGRVDQVMTRDQLAHVASFVFVEASA